MKEQATLPNKPPRPDKGRPQLTPRDDALLRLIGEQAGYRFDQIQSLLARYAETQREGQAFLSESRTYIVIKRWKQLGLVSMDKLYYHDPSWIWLTRKGLAHVHLALRYLDLYHANLDHLFWINETRAAMEELYGNRAGFQWESERQFRTTREHLKAEQKREPWLSLPLEYKGAHIPDAVIRYRRSEQPDAPEVVSAIEVELSAKKAQRWRNIFLELCQRYSQTHYFVDEAIKDAFVKALTHFQNEEPQFGDPSSERRQSICVHDLERHL